MVRVRTRYKLSLVFQSKNREMVEYRVSLHPDLPLNLTLKSPYLKSDLRNEFFGPVYHMKWF